MLTVPRILKVVNSVTRNTLQGNVLQQRKVELNTKELNLHGRTKQDQ